MPGASFWNLGLIRVQGLQGCPLIDDAYASGVVASAQGHDVMIFQ